ncbi:hypothetical protein T4B_15495 [Trichinella pseudospiralis]|uniref:Uncharacterized protein n=1 Tax=Trichinella pseudospiralis TaxID=6337 RepID=A0A0V1INZ3_TRIPS|nr:hypothetical protein T4B_15495 [Trichinella pseudospiralis]
MNSLNSRVLNVNPISLAVIQSSTPNLLSEWSFLISIAAFKSAACHASRPFSNYSNTTFVDYNFYTLQVGVLFEAREKRPPSVTSVSYDTQQ